MINKKKKKIFIYHTLLAYPINKQKKFDIFGCFGYYYCRIFFRLNLKISNRTNSKAKDSNFFFFDSNSNSNHATPSSGRSSDSKVIIRIFFDSFEKSNESNFFLLKNFEFYQIFKHFFGEFFFCLFWNFVLMKFSFSNNNNEKFNSKKKKG